MSLFRKEVRSGNPFGEPVVSPFPSSIWGGQSGVSMDTAMQASAVWACVRLVCDTISMMPVNEFTMDSAGVRRPLPPSPLVKSPSSDATMPDWLYMVVASLMLKGNAYGYKSKFDGTGYPTQIDILSPDDVSTAIDGKTNQVQYRFRGNVIDKDLMWHTRAYRAPGSPLGLSPIKYHAVTINIDAAVQDFAYGFFRDGAHPSSILTTDQTVDKDGARTIKDRLNAAVQGREPLVVGAGLKYQQIQVNPEESQFLATQKYGVAQIARIFGVPPEMIAAESGTSMTYSNVEQRAIDFLTYSIQPWLTKLEAALAPLLPGQRHVRFDTSVLLRTDLETTLKATAIGIASKQMTVDEARAMRDAAPLTSQQKKDLELVPLTVSPSGMVKDAPPGLNPGAAPAQGPVDSGVAAPQGVSQ